MAKVALKYCGSCNPQVSLSAIAAHLTGSAARLGFQLVPAGDEADITVVLCGCPRACGMDGSVKGSTLLVAGGSVNGRSAPAGELAGAVESELLKILKGA